KLCHEQVEVRHVVSVNARPSSAEDPGGASHDVDANARVVGDAEQAAEACESACFEQRILFEGGSVLDGRRRAEVARCHHLLGTEPWYEAGQDVRDLARLVRVVRGDRYP